MERKSKTHPASIIFEAEGVVLPQFLPTEMGGERPVPALFQFRPGESIVGRKQFVVFQSENETAALIFRGVRDLHYTPKPEAVDQREDRRRRGATSRSQKGKPRTFLFPPVFVSRGNAIRDIVSIVPLIEKIKLFSFFLSSLFFFFFQPLLSRPLSGELAFSSMNARVVLALPNYTHVREIETESFCL